MASAQATRAFERRINACCERTISSTLSACVIFRQLGQAFNLQSVRVDIDQFAGVDIEKMMMKIAVVES